MYGVIAAVVVAAAVIPTALIATKDDGKAAPPTGQVTPTPTPSPTPSTTIVAFPNGGVAIKAPEDTAKLVGTSDDFKTFIKGVWQKDFDSGCKTAEVDVMKYTSDGFGLGGVGGCGGYQALWAQVDGTWKEVLHTQDEWRCPELTELKVPDGFAGECYTPDPPPAVVNFGEKGIHVISAADVDRLDGTTLAFRQFILDTALPKAKAGLAECHQADPQYFDPDKGGVWVYKFAQAGYAVGEVDDCSGYMVLWRDVDSTWKQVVGTQEQFSCADLDRYDIPHSFIEGDCFDASEQFGPTWAFAFKIGQTTEQVRGVGGTITGDPEGDCATVTKPNVVGSANDPLKEVAMTRGKVIAIFASEGFYTPKGIGIGSTEDEVKTAYPNGQFDGMGGYYHVPINSLSEYEIGFNGSKKVSELLIQTTGEQRCYG
jgi:hypothetical protein